MYDPPIALNKEPEHNQCIHRMYTHGKCYYLWPNHHQQFHFRGIDTEHQL